MSHVRPSMSRSDAVLLLQPLMKSGQAGVTRDPRRSMLFRRHRHHPWLCIEEIIGSSRVGYAEEVRAGRELTQSRSPRFNDIESGSMPRHGTPLHSPPESERGRISFGDLHAMSIPFYSKSENSAPFQRALSLAASRSGVSPHTAAYVLTHLFEQIALEVSKGRVVRIPGFGCFGPWLDERKFVVAKNGAPVVRPAFAASRGFQQEVRHTCPPNRAGKKSLTRYRRSHSPGGHAERSARTVLSAMLAWRRQIVREMPFGPYENQ